MVSNFKAANIFSQVQYEKFPRHNFDTSYLNTFSMNHGLAVPFFLDDVMPGDKIDINTFGKVQLQPLATSTFQRLTLSLRYFYVPYRLVCPDWDRMISQDGFESPELPSYTVLTGTQLNSYLPDLYSTITGPGKLLDMLGVNIWNVNEDGSFKLFDVKAKLAFNLFAHYAYWLVWNTYYRDENLLDSLFDTIPEHLQLGYNDPQPYIRFLNTLLPIAYEKDYYTTALPWRQKGQPINLSSFVQSAILNGHVDFNISTTDGISNVKLFGLGSEGGDNGRWSAIDGYKYSPDGITWAVPTNINPNLEIREISTNSIVNLPANELSSTFDINELRYANALQRYLERLATGGNRPAEFYLSMYGVQIDDLRIGQPYYLGGGKTDILVTDVVQQTQKLDDDSSPLGTLAGNGRVTPHMKINHPYVCHEPGIVIGICSIRPEINYSQGLSKNMQLFSHLEYPNPLFAHLGEQEVMTSELFIKPDINNDPRDIPNNNDTIFGYQSRYAYKKFKRNEVHGDFKTSLSHWLLGVHFDNEPYLNADFINVDQDYSIFAVTDAKFHHYLCELYNDYSVDRTLPDFVIPSL